MRTPKVLTMDSHALHSIVNRLDTLLEISKYSDMAVNGLQVEAPSVGVKKVGFAVDAGYSVIEAAANAHCDLLVVHHGILWGGCLPLVGPLARKIHLCMSKGVSLYAAHLPLDGHPEVGNAARLAQLLGLTETSPGFLYKGSPIGVVGTSPTPQSPHDIARRLSTCEGALQPPLVLPFGPSQARRIGIATGSATSVIPECAAHGIDTLITGESKQEAYHNAKEYGVNLICMGHYASETFGVRALERILQTEFRVETCFISEPTGI